MDPTANLKEALEIAAKLAEGHYAYPDHDDPTSMLEDGQRLAELLIALDEWIRNGGFLPDAWAAPLLARIKRIAEKGESNADARKQQQDDKDHG